MYVPFGQWQPDADDQGGRHLTVARNVIPAEGAYRPFKKFARNLVAPAGTGVLDAKIIYRGDKVATLYAGTATAIYRAAGLGFVAINTGLTTSTSWDFAQWGSEIIAVSPEAGLYVGDPDAGGALSAGAGSPPAAEFVERFDDFLMLGAAGGNEFRLQWSGFNDRTAWGTDPATQADFQDLPREYGRIMGLVPGQYQTVFQERAISRVTYVGPPSVFSIDTLPVQKGSVAKRGLAQVFGLTFFLAQDGPNVWDGQSARPIANGRYRRWWRDSVTTSQAATARAGIDFENNCVVWQWSGGGLVYSWEQDRAAEFSPGVSFPVLLSAPLSKAEGDATTHPAWRDTLMNVGAIDSDGFYGAFTGEPYEATFETADNAISRARRSLVTEVWPDTDAATAYVSLGTRQQRQTDALAYSAETAINDTGCAPVLSDARFHRIKLRIPAGESWTHTKGAEVTARPTGRV